MLFIINLNEHIRASGESGKDVNTDLFSMLLWLKNEKEDQSTYILSWYILSSCYIKLVNTKWNIEHFISCTYRENILNKL
jgi:hypothetical protein